VPRDVLRYTGIGVVIASGDPRCDKLTLNEQAT